MSAVAPGDADVRNIQFAPGNDPLPGGTPYPATLSVCLRFGGLDRRRSAIDVSLDGMFVESPDFAAEGEAVQVLVALPGMKPLRVLASVERIVTPDEAAFAGGMPGMGLRFMFMDRRLAEEWGEYLADIASRTEPKERDARAVEHRIEPADHRRSEVRTDGVFLVRYANQREGRPLETRNVSKHGLFVACAEPKEPGELVHLVIRHPISRRQFPLVAEVRWVRTKGPASERGMGLRIVERDAASDEAFVVFMNQG